MRDSKGRFVKNHPVKQEWIESIKLAHIGVPHSDEWKKNQSDRMLSNKINCGRVQTDEEKEKNRQSQFLRYDKIGRCNYSATYRERRSKKYKDWMNKVLERDDYTCKITKVNGVLSAHHIESFANNKALRYEIDNGFTMLKPLHIVFHKIYGFGRNTKQQLDDFIELCNELLSEIEIFDSTKNNYKKEELKYGCSIGALYEAIYRVKVIKFGEPFKMGIPSEASLVKNV